MRDDEIVSSIEFVLAEILRLQTAVKQDGPEHHIDDLLFGLPSPDGLEWPCGRAAHKQFDMVIDEALKRTKLSGRIPFGLIRPILWKLASEQSGETNIDVLLDELRERIVRFLTDATYFVPCHLVSVLEPERLQIGPVIFHNRRSFRREMQDALKKARSIARESNNTNLLGWTAAPLRYLRRFNWVAAVEIRDCEHGMASELAEHIVESALDGLQIALGAQYTYKMRIGGPSLLTDQPGRLSLYHTGEIGSTFSTMSYGHVGFEEGWHHFLSCHPLPEYLELFGRVLDMMCRGTLSPLGQRLLDSARWFGEATREERSTTKLIKFVVALERNPITLDRILRR